MLTRLRRTRPVSVRNDILAGLAVTALLVPQGIAYAELAGLPSVVGLYASLVPLLVYAAIGPSRILILGPDSALAPLVAAVVVPLARDDPSERIAIAGLLAIIVGGFLLLGAVAHLAFLTDLLSKPVRVGFLAGLAVIVTVEQLPRLLGYQVEGGNLIEDLEDVIRHLDRTDAASLGLGLLTILLIVGARRFAPVFPGIFAAVVLSTGLVKALGLDVAVMGPIPTGLPQPAIPTPSIDDLAKLIASAAAIAVLAFADTSILSRSYSSRRGERVDQNRELVALGCANIATGFLQGFPVSSSASRTPVAEAAGASSQLAGFVAAVGIGLVLVLGTGLLEDIPQSVLAAVVITAVVRLVDLRAFRWLAAVNTGDLGLAAAALVGVVAFGVLPGVGIAVSLSAFALMERAWHPYNAVLGRVAGLKGYHDMTRHPEALQVPGLVLFRFDAPLFFANADVFRQAALRAVASVDGARRLVVAAEPMTDIDSTAAEMLGELPGELQQSGVSLEFAEMKGPVKDQLRRYGIFDQIGEEHFYPTIGQSVRAYIQDYGVEWQDWEDEEAPEST